MQPEGTGSRPYTYMNSLFEGLKATRNAGEKANQWVPTDMSSSRANSQTRNRDSAKLRDWIVLGVSTQGYCHICSQLSRYSTVEIEILSILYLRAR